MCEKGQSGILIGDAYCRLLYSSFLKQKHLKNSHGELYCATLSRIHNHYKNKNFRSNNILTIICFVATKGAANVQYACDIYHMARHTTSFGNFVSKLFLHFVRSCHGHHVVHIQGCWKQGKQGIWRSIFPDTENTWNLPKILKICFYTGNLTPTQGKFGVEKKKMSL